MILKLHNKQIIIKANEYPEDIENAKVSYEFEVREEKDKIIVSLPFGQIKLVINLYLSLPESML